MKAEETFTVEPTGEPDAVSESEEEEETSIIDTEEYTKGLDEYYEEGKGEEI